MKKYSGIVRLLTMLLSVAVLLATAAYACTEEDPPDCSDAMLQAAANAICQEKLDCGFEQHAVCAFPTFKGAFGGVCKAGCKTCTCVNDGSTDDIPNDPAETETPSWF